jgi:hypothetical protein
VPPPRCRCRGALDGEAIDPVEDRPAVLELHDEHSRGRAWNVVDVAEQGHGPLRVAQRVRDARRDLPAADEDRRLRGRAAVRTSCTALHPAARSTASSDPSLAVSGVSHASEVIIAAAQAATAANVT